jgi:predicted AlkP superfamily phosphohydrolase/phosphomutase
VTGRVLFVGLDSADPGLLDRYAREGLLPTLSRPRGEGPTFELANSIGTLADTIWPEVWSGRPSHRTGFYCPHHQFAAADRRSSHRLRDSRLRVRGPAVAAGAAGSGSILDVAPAVLARPPLEAARTAPAGGAR